MRLSRPTSSLLRQQNADVVAFNVVGDEIGLAVMIHVDDFDAPGASSSAKGRSGRALKAATTVAEKYPDTAFRPKSEVDLTVAIQIHRHDAPGAVAEFQRRIFRLHKISLAVAEVKR